MFVGRAAFDAGAVCVAGMPTLTVACPALNELVALTSVVLWQLLQRIAALGFSGVELHHDDADVVHLLL